MRNKIKALGICILTAVALPILVPFIILDRIMNAREDFSDVFEDVDAYLIESTARPSIMLTDDEFPDDPGPIIRPNCAFCGRERTPLDNNHAPNCAYWSFLG